MFGITKIKLKLKKVHETNMREKVCSGSLFSTHVTWVTWVIITLIKDELPWCNKSGRVYLTSHIQFIRIRRVMLSVGRENTSPMVIIDYRL